MMNLPRPLVAITTWMLLSRPTVVEAAQMKGQLGECGTLVWKRLGTY